MIGLSDLIAGATSILFLVLGAWAGRKWGQGEGLRKGRRETWDAITEADRAKADAIRNRVERERAGSLHKYQDSGYRNE